MPAKNDVASKYYSGQGVVLLGEKDATTGEPKGFVNIGNVSSLALNIEATKLEHKESTTGARGVDLTLQSEIKARINMVMESINADNLALALKGDVTNVAAGSVTAGGDRPIAYLGKTISLLHLNVSTVVVKDSAVTITYEEGKNYEVNPEVGSITIYTDAEQTTKGAANNIAELDVLDITYSFAAYDDVNALTSATPVRWLRFEGLNTAEDNKSVVVDVFKFSVTPLGELALINDEVGQMSVEGDALADATRSSGSQYYRERIAT